MLDHNAFMLDFHLLVKFIGGFLKIVFYLVFHVWTAHSVKQLTFFTFQETFDRGLSFVVSSIFSIVCFAKLIGFVSAARTMRMK